jgi:hypothetical protein
LGFVGTSASGNRFSGKIMLKQNISAGLVQSDTIRL